METYWCYVFFKLFSNFLLSWPSSPENWWFPGTSWLPMPRSMDLNLLAFFLFLTLVAGVKLHSFISFILFSSRIYSFLSNFALSRWWRTAEYYLWFFKPDLLLDKTFEFICGLNVSFTFLTVFIILFYYSWPNRLCFIWILQCCK